MSEWDAFPLVGGGEPTRITVRPQDAGGGWDEFPLVSQGPEQPDIGRTRAAITGAAQGLSANFGDEIAGIKHAFSRWLYEQMSGEAPEAGKYYEKARDQFRADTKTAERQYPGTTLASNIAGAASLPVGPLMAAPTILGRMARGAGVGGVFGGLSGVGGGETATERASGGVTGAGIGFGLGGAASPVVEGVARGARFAATPITNLVRGTFRPDAEAARRVGHHLQTAVDSDPNAAGRLTAAEFNATPSATLMDLGGESTGALARSAANSSQAARGVLTRGIEDRFSGQSGRLSHWLQGTFNFPNAHATREALDRAGTATNRANYGQAYQDGAEGIWTPGLERLAGSRAVSGAMQRASQAAGDEAIVSGHGAMNPRITFTPDGRIQHNRAPNGMPTYPDLQFWDLTRRELSAAAEAARRSGNNTEARRLETFARLLNEELDRAVPTYSAARRGAAEFFGAQNALEAGENFVGAGTKFGFREAQAQIARFTPEERQLFQDGYASRFIEAVLKHPDRQNVLNKIAQSEPARRELEIALGRQRWLELEARLRIERIMDSKRAAVTGNSTTARQVAELGLAGGIGGAGAYNSFDPNAIAVAGFIVGRRHVNDRVSRRVAEMLMSRDPAVIQRVTQMVARNNNFMQNLRRLDSRVATGVTSGVEPEQGAAVTP